MKNTESHRTEHGRTRNGSVFFRDLFRVVPWLVLLAPLTWAGVKAGVSRADITPPPGIAMWGYGARTGVSTGVLDSLYARVLVLDDGFSTVALVTLDLGRTFGPRQMDWVRGRARAAGVVGVIFAASHTHSGPVIEDAYPEGHPPAWEQKALEEIVGAIGRAYASRKEARLGAGWGVVYIGHDRRYVRLDGSVRMLWRNATAVPTYPMDPTVGVLRIDNAEGRPLAILVNYACHPVVLGPDNLRYSADYPGAMTRFVDQNLGGMTFFLQGAPGDINPYLDKTPLLEDAENEMVRTGERLGQAVVSAARAIVTQPKPNARLGLRVEPMRFRLRWNEQKLRAMIERAAPRLLAWVQPGYELPSTTLTIGDEFAFVGMPGEPFVSYQMDLRARSPVPYTYFLGYTNGYFGYFPGIREAAAGGYGANGITTRVEVGAGERMLDRGIINLYRLLGKLSDQPEKPQ